MKHTRKTERIGGAELVASELNFSISTIESLTEAKAKKYAEESIEIKGHTIYFIDFGGYFGYSACVFCNGHHICYANDYELHHNHDNLTHEELKELYIQRMNNILFTEEELSAPLKDYDEYRRKSYFLTNYYGMRESHYSVWSSKEDRKASKVKGLYASSVNFSYYDNKEFVDKLNELEDALENAQNQLKNNFEYWVNAFVYEMGNHEYHINWQADFDTLSAFGNPVWRHSGNSLTFWFDDVNFNETQRKAYREAIRRYSKMVRENNWG